jgi:hypothetical protein
MAGTDQSVIVLHISRAGTDAETAAPEDANAIQVGLMRIQKAMIEDTISTKKAGLLLYSMQLALTNVGQTTFGRAKDEEMVRDTVDEEEALSEKQRPFTTKDTKDMEEEQGIPLMNADLSKSKIFSPQRTQRVQRKTKAYH